MKFMKFMNFYYQHCKHIFITKNLSAEDRILE